MNIAHVCTPHGLGHITRQIAIAVSLKDLGCQSTFYCHNSSLVHESLPSAVVIQKYADVGIIQPDANTVDIEKTLSILKERCTVAAIDDWAETLRNYQLVIADIPPLIFAAAQKANVPVLGMGNFDWIWIYQHFPQLKQWSEKMKRWQQGHHAIQLLPGAPIHGSIQTSAHWIARANKDYIAPLTSTSILVGFGNLTKNDILKLPYIKNVSWILPKGNTITSRHDIRSAQSLPFPALVKTVDIIFSKAGYGILAESQVTGTPQIWMKRASFPEANILESFALSVGDIVISEQWGTKKWKKELREAVLSLKGIRRPVQQNESHRIAQWIIKKYSLSKKNNEVR